MVCDLDLMARLASLAVEDKYELYEGDGSGRRPSIIVTPCAAVAGGMKGFGRGNSADVGNGQTDSDGNSDSELPVKTPTKVQLPHTSRPPLNE